MSNLGIGIFAIVAAWPLVSCQNPAAASPAAEAEAPAAGAAASRLEHRWDLTQIYPSDEAWQTALDELSARKDAIAAYKGRLGESADVLKKTLDALHDLGQRIGKLGAYAGMRSDEDTRLSGPQGMKQALQTVAADVTAAVAWVDPEILAIPPERLEALVDGVPGLQQYRRYLERLAKRRPHVLVPESERILGMAQLVQGEGAFIGNILRNAEMPWRTVELTDGNDLRVDVQGYSLGRAFRNRADRVKTYEAFYETLRQFKESLAATLSATVKEHVFGARVRNYASCLDASLAANEVDTAVYRMLVKEVNAALPTLHRYLRLRGRLLGIDHLRYHDMYPPMVEAIEAAYDWDDSKDLVLSALGTLGDEYVRRLRKALENRWVDIYPREGKRSGAYVNGSAYGVHPYMLLNHQDDYHSMSTLAHEGGHLMHSWYSQEIQPYSTSDYSIFVAEVASTVNEVLLFRAMLEQAKDDDERLILLGNYLEVFRLTVFRQTMFAEFELAIHEAAERGQPLTSDVLDAMYVDLLRRYHGHGAGIVEIDELYGVEWAFVPHFHYDFYVYQYATSYVAAVALGERIHAGEAGAAQRHIAFLGSGSSKPPVELLADAGVDMTSPEPIRAAIRAMDEVIDQIETILKTRRD
ncbi:MAG: oligoendopeptidase F [Planctomycetes bacterium]|nr:oligoendopeptidase F [Planctomycetota bacterium]